MFCRGSTLVSRIFFAVMMESMMMMMLWILSFSMVSINPVQMAISLAFIDVTFTE